MKFVVILLLSLLVVGPKRTFAQTTTPSLTGQPEHRGEVAASSSGQSNADKGDATTIPTFKVNAQLVSLFLSVTDANGALVGGLSREDFAVTEDSYLQNIAVFERQAELPLSIVLAIDTSGSVQKDMASEQEAARSFVQAILRSQDVMEIFEFADEVRELVGFTNQPARVNRALNKLRGGNSTAFYDAIYLGAQSLAGRQGRKVLIVISDGGDTAGNTTYARALERALRSEVMVYSLIDVPIEASAGRELDGEHAMITLAEQTGGRHFYVNQGGLKKAFAQVAEDLRTQYLIGYYPDRQDKAALFHRVRVTIPRAAPGAFVLSYRSGYYPDTAKADN